MLLDPLRQLYDPFMLGYGKSSGAIDKRVQCEKCGSAYYYRLVREVHAFTIMPLLTTVLPTATDCDHCGRFAKR